MPDNVSALIWLQTLCHSDDILERIFKKKGNFGKKIRRQQISMLNYPACKELRSDLYIFSCNGPDMQFFFCVKLLLFSYLSLLICVLGAQKNRLIETVLLRTHNICFGLEIKKIVFQYPL